MLVLHTVQTLFPFLSLTFDGKRQQNNWLRPDIFDSRISDVLRMASHLYSRTMSSCPIYAFVLLAAIFWEVAADPPNVWAGSATADF